MSEQDYYSKQNFLCQNYIDFSNRIKNDKSVLIESIFGWIASVLFDIGPITFLVPKILMGLYFGMFSINHHFFRL